VQIWNTLGLSQPSRSAECEKMNATGSSNDSNFSLARMIKSKAVSSSLERPVLSWNSTSPDLRVLLAK
jgi:hypothetical protein